MTDFYEEDEPVEEVIAAFESGDKKTTAQDYRKLLGKQVMIKLEDHSTSKTLVTGKLLAISDFGQACYQKEDGETWWCWPVLEMQELKLPAGLCHNKEDHEPHLYYSNSLGAIQCHANQSLREPYASEQRRNQANNK